MRQIFHDEGLQQQFIRSGYNRVPMLSAEDVSHILSRLATLFALPSIPDYERQTHALIELHL
jgi:hypothetical protein